MFSLDPASIPRAATLRIAITIATALLGASLLTTPRPTAQVSVRVGTLLLSPAGGGVAPSPRQAA